MNHLTFQSYLPIILKSVGFPGGSDSKESACKVRDLDLIPGSGRAPGEGSGYPSSILAWKIPRTEEPGRLQPMGSQNMDMTK